MKIPIEKIELIVYDFDGVMTNNKAIIDQFGNESVIVNRSDGLAITYFKKDNMPQLILSTEENPIVNKRAEKLKIPCIHGVWNKKEELEKYLKLNNINKDKVIYIGNDLNDFEVMKYVGFSVAPNDAVKDIKDIAGYVTNAKGGDGVVRELWDMIKKDR